MFMSVIATPRRLAAILHADVAGYSRLMGANEEDTLGRLTAYRAMMADCIGQHGGRVVDTAGDSLLAEFSSVVEATRCALELQEMLTVRNADLPPERRLEFRMGIEMADVLDHDEGVYGDGVNVAARIQALAKPGGLCVSDAVRRSVANRLPVSFEPLGELSVKNITEPVRAFRVLPTTEGSVARLASAVPPSRKPSYLLIGAIVIALVGLLAVWVLSQKQVEPPAKPVTDQASKSVEPAAKRATVSSDKPSIAVLPFINLSDDKAQEYFSDGISEDIIIDLSRVSNLQVIARNSSFYYKGRTVKAEEVGRELGVGYVLVGSVRKAGDRVRVTAELVDSKDAHQLWTDKFDRKLEDIFAVQDEITQKIVSALVIQLSAREKAELAVKATRNVAAYDLFLRGQQHEWQRTSDDSDTARSLYREAIQLDPNFGRAYGALAVSLARSMAWGLSEKSAQGLDEALTLAQQAVDLNGNLPQTHWALGYVHLRRHEYEKALASASRSIELAANYSDGYALLALINNTLGRGQEAIRAITRGMALNPHYTWDYSYNLGLGYYHLADYNKAAMMFLDALERNPNIGYPRVFLISTYIRLDRIDDARWEVAQLQASNPYMTLSRLRRSTLDTASPDRLLLDLEKAGLTL